MKIKSDTKMDLAEKYTRIKSLSKILNNLIILRKTEIKKEHEKMMDRKIKLELMILKNNLFRKMGGSSFGMDFHALRFI